MATFTHGKGAQFKINDSGGTVRDLSVVANQIERSRSAETAEANAFGDSDKKYLAGLKDGTYSIEGPRDLTTEGYLDGILGLDGVRYWYYPEGGSASGKVQFSGTAILTSFSESSNLSDANTWSGELQISGGELRSVL